MVQTQCDYELLRSAAGVNITVYAGSPTDAVPDDIPEALMAELAKFAITDRLDKTFEAPLVVKKVLCDFSMLHRQVVGTEKAAAKVKEIVDLAERSGAQLGTIWRVRGPQPSPPTSKVRLSRLPPPGETNSSARVSSQRANAPTPADPQDAHVELLEHPLPLRRQGPLHLHEPD